jgi:hypothetical protein
MAIPTQSPAREFFSFRTYHPPQTFSDATRKLCCAPYVDSDFANEVVREVVEDEQRAVPPSHGFDLNPVVRHCLRARRLLISRDAVLTGLVLVGLCLTPLTVAWLFVGFALLAARSRRVRRLPTQSRLWIIGAILAAAIVFCCLGGLFSAWTRLLSGTSSSFDSVDGTVDVPSAPSLGLWSSDLQLYAPVLLGLATFVALFAFRHKTYTIITQELAQGRTAVLPAVASERVSRRLAVVASAQLGNTTVHEKDPFLGSGDIEHGWSFVVNLRQPGRDTQGAARVDLDVTELYDRVREAVLGLRDARLPARERVPGLYLTPHLVADGVRGQHDPLLHPRDRVPYTVASDEAIKAILRHPQGGVRYYERVVIPAAGKEVRSADERIVMPPQNLGIEISAYIHFAVEGGLLYTEFMATVMPPVQERYELVDKLHPDRIAGRAILDSLRHFPDDTAASGWRLIRSGWHIITTQWRMDRASRASREFREYDYGARLSVRRHGADPAASKFLQQLDAWKYIKLLDRAVGDSIVAVLAEHGVDTAELSGGITHVLNSYSTVNNISGGQVNLGGVNASFTQQNERGGQQ